MTFDLDLNIIRDHLLVKDIFMGTFVTAPITKIHVPSCDNLYFLPFARHQFQRTHLQVPKTAFEVYWIRQLYFSRPKSNRAILRVVSHYMTEGCGLSDPQ